MAIKNLGRWSPTTPWLGAKKKTAANWPRYVCRNKSCKSYGKSHPNCRCGAPFADLAKNYPGQYYADGGPVVPGVSQDVPLAPGSSPDLSMEELPRQMRAIEMGFDPTKTYYHGTDQNFDAFTLPPKERPNSYGQGIYTSESPHVAAGYAGSGRGDNPGEQIIPAHLKMERPFEFFHTIPDDVKNKLPQIIGKKLAKQAFDYTKGADDYNYVLWKFLKNHAGNDPNYANDILRKLGYDGLNIPNEKVTVVFDPKQLRSKFAKFDPTHKDKAGLHYDEGGEVHHCESHQAHDPSCEHFADGGTIQANHDFENHPGLAIDHAIAHHGLLHALTKLGHSKSENPNKPSEDFHDHTQRGRKSLKHHAENHFNPKHELPEAHKDEASALRAHLDSIRENPSQLLDTGGFDDLPAHSAALGAKAATVSDYMDTIRPKQAKPGPLDPTVPPDKMAEQSYRRQLGIAERPLSILEKVRSGTILPSDLQTLNTLYPDLAQSIQKQAFEALVNAKTNGTKISRAHKQGLSFLLGQPLDATMTQPAMAAIMRANAGAQTESQGAPSKRSGATEATQKSMAKVDDLYRTQLERIQAEK
jgi:hypothetical protein